MHVVIISIKKGKKRGKKEGPPWLVYHAGSERRTEKEGCLYWKKEEGCVYEGGAGRVR